MDNNFYTEEDIKKMGGGGGGGGGGVSMVVDFDKLETQLPDTQLLLSKVVDIMECMDTKEIRELKKKDKNEYEQVLERKFPKFSFRYYGLFKKVISGDDLSMLFKMVKAIDKVNNNELSLDDAEFGLGEDLAYKYIPNYEEIKKAEMRN